MRAKARACEVHPERKFFECRGKEVAELLFDECGITEDAGLFRIVFGVHEAPLADGYPGNLPGDKIAPAATKFALLRVGGVGPPLHVDEERELGEMQVLVEVLRR